MAGQASAAREAAWLRSRGSRQAWATIPPCSPAHAPGSCPGNEESLLAIRLFRSTVVVSAMTTLSRILGYVRDVYFAVLMGASAGPAADAFLVAFKIPNFLRRLFAEGAFSQAFVPVLSEYRVRRDRAAVRELVAAASGTLGAVLVLVTAAGVLAAPVLVAVFAPGFLDDAPKYAMATDLLRVTFPYLLFISLTALAGGVLNTYGRFAVPALTPVLLNLSIIAMAAWVAPGMAEPVYALAWGVFIGGVAQLAVQVPFLLREGLLVRPRLRPGHPGVRRIATLMIPAILGVSVVQVNLLLDTLLASFLQTGSVSWLYYSDRLVEFPLGIFGISLGIVILPVLAAEFAGGSAERFARSLDWALRWVALIAVPATVGLLLLAGPMLVTLFQHGAFELADARMASLSLAAYALGLTGFILVKVLAPGFYARQDTRTPVRIAVIAMIANMVMNLMLVFSLAHAGLALATSLAAYVNSGLLYGALRREGIYRPEPGWGWFLGRIVLASVGLGLLLWLGPAELEAWARLDGADRAWRLLAWVAGGAVCYVLLLLLLGLRPRALLRPNPGG